MSDDEVAAVLGGGERPGGDDAWAVHDVDCEETVRRLYHFLDGELTEERRRAISVHLDGCGDCFEALGFETELRRVVADRCKEHVPESLKRRIAEAIRRECEEQSRGAAQATGGEPA